MNKKSLITVMILTLLCLEVYGQTINLSKFTETITPKVASKAWYELNHSQDEFGVEVSNGQLLVKKAEEKNRCQIKISNGDIVGINRGEWGGKLTFVPSDSKKKEIEIKEGNIKFIFSLKDKIYFIEGLAHLSISEGALYELDITNNKFAYKKVLDFDDSPEAYTIREDQIMIATHKNFYVVKGFKKELVFKDMFWSSLYPNSIAALDDNSIFMGIRSGYVKLNIQKKEIKFYKYSQ